MGSIGYCCQSDGVNYCADSLHGPDVVRNFLGAARHCAITRPCRAVKDLFAQPRSEKHNCKYTADSSKQGEWNERTAGKKTPKSVTPSQFRSSDEVLSTTRVDGRMQGWPEVSHHNFNRRKSKVVSFTGY